MGVKVDPSCGDEHSEGENFCLLECDVMCNLNKPALEHQVSHNFC
jgi:hypothetical protein